MKFCGRHKNSFILIVRTRDKYHSKAEIPSFPTTPKMHDSNHENQFRVLSEKIKKTNIYLLLLCPSSLFSLMAAMTGREKNLDIQKECTDGLPLSHQRKMGFSGLPRVPRLTTMVWKPNAQPATKQVDTKHSLSMWIQNIVATAKII